MRKMLRWSSCLLLTVLVLAAMLILPAKASATPVLTPKAPAVVFEGAVEYAIYFTVTDGDELILEDMGLVTYRTKPEQGTLEDAYRVIPGVDYDAITGRYIAYTGDIPAMRLGDDLYFRIYARMKDGSYVYSRLLDYSILDYAHNALTKDQYTEEFRNLIASLLDYASAAQVYFGYRTDAPANRVLETGGHLYGDSWTLVTKPTLGAPGTEQKTCTICKGAPLTREIPQLTVTALTVTTLPVKTDYFNGEAFDPGGMEITATLSDGSEAIITDYTLDKQVLNTSDLSVTVSYGGKNVTVPVNVSPHKKVYVSQLDRVADGVTVAVEGYYVGVAEEGPSADREMLLKDPTTDDLIAVRHIPYGSFPDYGYRPGDRICLLVTPMTDNTVNTPNKRYLDYHSGNGSIDSTVISSGNAVTYDLNNVITVRSWAELQSLFAVGSIPDYSYIRLEGPIYVNRYTGSDGITTSRIHMNEAATGISGIRCDGSRTVSLRDNVMEANLGLQWQELFFEEMPAEGRYPGIRLTGSVTAVYTGGNNYYFQLTVLDEDWVELQEFDSTEAVTTAANAYYLQGTQIQYDQSNRRRNLNIAPEAATAETAVYLDCSSYVNSVYRTAFGVNVMDNEENPSTAGFAEYCRGGTTSDVMGYWVNADYTTDSQIQQLLTQVRSRLQIGDLLIYRHGTEADPAGHVYIYMGDDIFLHCTGSSYLYGATPGESRDRATVAEKTGGAIRQIHADEIFVNTASTRYLFKATEEDTVTCFGLIRPLNRGLTVTEQMKDRLRYRGLDTELQVDAGQYTGICDGQTLTYTLTLTNPSGSQLSDVPIRVTLPEQVTPVSAGEMTLTDNVLIWTGKVDAGAVVTLTWTVRVNAPSGSLITTQGTVGTVPLNVLINTVSGYTGGRLSAVASEAAALAGSSFADPLAMANKAYTAAVGFAPFEGDTARVVLNLLIDKDVDTLRTDTRLSGMAVPNLYGGLDLKNGFVTDNSRTRLVTEGYLTPGDVIVAEYDGIYEVFVYLGQGQLVKVSSADGICTLVTSAGDAYTFYNVFNTFISYDCYVVLRPSMVG